MKGKRIKVEQIIRILQEAERSMPVTEVCCRHNGSEKSFNRWMSSSISDKWCTGCHQAVAGGIQHHQAAMVH